MKVPFFDATRILSQRHEPTREQLKDGRVHTQWTTISEAYEAACSRVIRSGRYILGSEVEAFEREAATYLGAPHAVAVSSGTDALILALRCLDVGPGCTVAVPAFTFIATAEAVVRVGAKPVFVDADERGMMNPHAALRTPCHAAIAVDLFGCAARARKLEQCANVPVITDKAQAFGSDRGVPSTLSTHSFYPTKNLPGLGDGGLVTTHDQRLADQLRSLRNHGQTTRGVHGEIGGNHRLDEIQAACLRVGLQHITEWLAMRKRTATRYDEGLVGLPIGLPWRYPGETWNQYVVQCNRRDELRAHLTAQGIGCDVYYPHALPHQPCFAHLGHKLGDFPMAERLARESLALPIFPGITDAEADAVIAGVRGFAW